MKISWKAAVLCCVLAVAGCRVSKPGAMEGAMAKEVKHKITVGGKILPTLWRSRLRCWPKARNISVITAASATDSTAGHRSSLRRKNVAADTFVSFVRCAGI